MTGVAMTIDALKRILQEGAGQGDDVSLDADILDQCFEDLGYDSVALLETIGRIEREFGVTLDDETAAEARTPRDLLAIVNAQ